MKRRLFLLPAAMVLLAYALRLDPPRTLSDLIERWERASHACQSLDVRVTRFHYSLFAGCDHPESIQCGRFFYEAPDRGRLEIGDDVGLVWNDGSSLCIDRWARTSNLFAPSGVARLRSAREQFVGGQQGERASWQRFWSGLWLAFPLRPTEAIPFVLLEDRAEIEKQFDILLGRLPDGPLLTLKPRDTWWKNRCEQIDVILDPATYRTFAVQVTSGQYRDVYVLNEPRVNTCPADRERLLDLSASK